MEKITPSLMNFIDDGEDFFQNVLVVESVDYVLPLLKRFPTADIFFVTPDEDIAEPFQSEERVHIFIMDYREERLPFDEEFFDAIIGDLTLEVVVNPQDIAAGFSTFLKQTGVWITSFRNIRHWKILEKLMRGHFNGLVSRFYTRADFERLLYASFYKHVRVSPLRKKAPSALLTKLLDCGFENFGGDLEVEFWMVRAARSMPELALLKSMYTPEIRAELSRILHRIEYNIDMPDSVKIFWSIYDAERMFTDYVAAFVRSAVVHREDFYKNLKNHSNRPEIDDIIDEAESFYYIDPDGGFVE